MNYVPGMKVENGQEIPLTVQERDALIAEWTQNDLSGSIANKREEIDALFNLEMSKVTSQYSQYEIDSWFKQEAEAKAFMVDSSAPVPMLSAIAAVRGSTIQQLASRVILKVNSYSAFTGVCIGRRQLALDKLAVATTVSDVSSISF